MKTYLLIIQKFVLYIALTAATVAMSFPLFWMISSSLKTIQETNSPGIVWIPAQPTQEAYI
jgi:ABC-type glycerol-3-phosphate transport system permease component